jgi:hypothetical protein
MDAASQRPFELLQNATVQHGVRVLYVTQCKRLKHCKARQVSRWIRTKIGIIPKALNAQRDKIWVYLCTANVHSTNARVFKSDACDFVNAKDYNPNLTNALMCL